MSFYFMAAVTICSDFGAQENKVSVSIVSPSICHEVIGPDAMILAQHDHSTTVGKFLGSSAFFMVQLLHPYMTTGKNVAFIVQTFVGKIMSLLFNTLSRFVIAFLPRSKRLLISWL